MKHKKLFALRMLVLLLSIPADICLEIGLTKILGLLTTESIAKLISISASLFLLVLIIRVFRGFLLEKYKTQYALAEQDFRVEIYHRQALEPLHKLKENTAGERKEQLDDDVATVVRYRCDIVPSCIASAVIALVYSVLVGQQWPWMTPILWGIALLQVLPPFIAEKYLARSYGECRDIESDITDLYLEGVGGFSALKTFGAEKWYMQRVFHLNQEYIPIGNRSIYCAEIETGSYVLVQNLLKYGTYFLVGVLAINGVLTSSGAIMIVALIGTFYESTSAFLAILASRGEYREAEKRLQIKETIPEQIVPETLEQLCLSNVSFSYEEENMLLKNTNLQIHKGEKCLIKGQNGGGKSTLLKLLSGLELPNEGAITLLPENCEKNAALFPDFLHLLPQEDAPLPETAEELFSAFPGQKERMTELSRLFGVSEEDRTHKKLTELSGGTRKKIFLSLGFGKMSRFLLLDEPENSLDAEGRQVLLELFKNYEGTVIAVSHSQCLDAVADRIIFVGEGGCCHE